MTAKSNLPSPELIPASSLAEGVEKLLDYRFERVSVQTPEADRQALINRNYATFQAQVEAGLGDWNRVHPYDIADWGGLLTDAEFGAWQDIRSAGRIPLWPRLPVDDMTVSFGNPVSKVALLCSTESDGTDAATAETEHRLKKLGWSVVTVTASQCLCEMESPADLRERTGEVSDSYVARFLSETLAGTLQYLRNALDAARKLP